MLKKLSILCISLSFLVLVSVVDLEKKNGSEVINTINNVLNEQNQFNNEIISINKEDIIKKLTCDNFKGRLTGSEGNKLTERYLVDLFTNIGLESVFDEGYRNSFIAKVPNTYGLVKKHTKNEKKELSNIVGKISGKDSSKAIIISAHFDHLGVQDGEIIRGAVDNASGVSIVLDLAEKLNKEAKTKKPEVDIIFCAFNGEEIGLLGSRNFVKDIKGKYDKLLNINIDSVGYKSGGDIIFLRKEVKNKSIYENMKISLNNNGINVSDKETRGLSDNHSFAEEGMANICLVEENIDDIIHSKEDTIDLIDFQRLDNITKSIIEFIKEISIS